MPRTTETTYSALSEEASNATLRPNRASKINFGSGYSTPNSRTAFVGYAALLSREPFVFITSSDAGSALRAELDGGGGNRTWVDVKVFVEDPAGGLTEVHSERVYVGDTPVEWLGPFVEEHWRGRGLRVLITDVVTGNSLADDCDKVSRT